MAKETQKVAVPRVRLSAAERAIKLQQERAAAQELQKAHNKQFLAALPAELLRLMALANDVNGSTKVQMNDGCVSVVFYFSELRAGNRDVLEGETITVTVSDVTGFCDKLRCETEFESVVSTIQYRERILREINDRRVLAQQTWENLTVEQREALGLDRCPE